MNLPLGLLEQAGQMVVLYLGLVNLVQGYALRDNDLVVFSCLMLSLGVVWIA